MNFYFVHPIKNVQILNPYFCILCIFLKELLHMCPCTCIINFYLIVLERAWLGGNDQLREGFWVWTDNLPCQLHTLTHWPARQQPLRWKIVLWTTLWRWNIGTMSPVTIKDQSFANSDSPDLNELLLCTSNKKCATLNPYFVFFAFLKKELWHMCPCTCKINFYKIVYRRGRGWVGLTSWEKGSGFGLTILQSTTRTGTWVSLTTGTL